MSHDNYEIKQEEHLSEKIFVNSSLSKASSKLRIPHMQIVKQVDRTDWLPIINTVDSIKDRTDWLSSSNTVDSIKDLTTLSNEIKKVEDVVPSNDILLAETLEPHTILTTNMMVQGKSMGVVIDTGAGVSVCKQQFLQKLNLDMIENFYHGPSLRTAAFEGQLTVVGKSCISITIVTQLH